MSGLNYIVIDLETSIKNRGEDQIGSNKASPFCVDNNIVLTGCKTNDMSDTAVIVIDGPPKLPFSPTISLLVGHNIKFDLLYLFRDSEFRKTIYENDIQIWDTMLAEYILTGQESKFVGLDYLSSKIGRSIKNDAIKEYWDNNVDTEDIPREELVPYLIEDVLNTEAVFLDQLERANKSKQFSLIMTQMDALLATTEMEYNGMFFNLSLSHALGEDLLGELYELEGELEDSMKEYGIPRPLVSSNMQIAAILHGGTLSYTDYECVGKYKTGPKAGKDKLKKVLKEAVIEAQCPVPKPEWVTPTGSLGASDAVIQDILSFTTDRALTKFLRTLTSYRKLRKDYTTYYKGYEKLTWPHNLLIHPNFNHCSTNTGRLSSSAPNFQNVSGKD